VLSTVFYTEFVGMTMIYFHTEFHMSSYSGSLVTAKQLKAKYTVYFMQPPFVHSTEKNYLNKSCLFFKYLLPSFEGPILNGASVALTSQVHASTMLLLLIIGK
jgi:hypothetical protein